MDKIERFKEMVAECSSIVFFGGAGVSTESGIRDYRSVDGLYHQKFKYPPEVMLSHDFLMYHSAEFYDFYRSNFVSLGAEPNAAHKKLAELEQKGKLIAVVTQNCDGLHQAAGSKNVYELHGSVHRNHCIGCGRKYDVSFIMDSQGVPSCSACGEMIRPEVVMYGESLDDRVVTGAVDAISRADMLIIGGTSLAVYPASGLINYFSGKYLVVINRESTPADGRASLVLNEKIGEIMAQIEC